MREIAWVALGGIFGAVARFLVGKWTVRLVTASFPAATLFINFLGSFIIGFFLVWTTERVLADPRWRLLVAIGFCGAFTTYSSYAFETLKMYEQGAIKLAVLNIVGNNLAALGAVVLGAALARKIA
jgi:CrcB protein